jgi:amidophosphoribosyltransferase
MSDQIKHECGIALVRLLKPLDFYVEKYGTAFYGLNKLQLLMQKQRNRGQDGAGIATIKLNPTPGNRYISRKRSTRSNAIKDIFEQVAWHFRDLTPEQLQDAKALKEKYPYIGELLMGHLRYGTHGGNDIETVHPFLRQNNWMSRNLVIAGNFNMTNVDELFNHLVKLGQHPKEKSDTVTVMERIGHFLDTEVQRLFDYHKPDHSNNEITDIIAEKLEVERVLSRTTRKLDGGYVMVGMIGHGDAFVMRDPNGIRPAFYYQNDEIVVAASERPAIQTVFDVPFEDIQELKPAHALIIKKSGLVTETQISEPRERKSCSFERIYFSRGTDRDIYVERKKLGELLAKNVLKSIDYDFKNTVFSFIPNTAEVAFFGLVEGATQIAHERQQAQILELAQTVNAQNGESKNFQKKLEEILKNNQIRIEKIVVKDEKQRTFITQDEARGNMVSYGYDVTYGIVKNHVDTLVLIDDSIVRGTTLKSSIIRIVARLKPKKIIIVSSSPQIRFPDCYGIDMSKIGDFVAFRAAKMLLEERGQAFLLDEVYALCKSQDKLPIEEVKNFVTKIYEPFTDTEISQKISEIITPSNLGDVTVEVIYQSVKNLHQACPNHTGDWYFTGNYPTPGGNRIANRAFINFMEKKNVRAY